MSVYKQKGSDVYRIQFVLGGQTYIKSSRTTVKSVALQMEANWRAEIHNRLYLGKKEPITVDEMFKSYLSKPHAKTTLKNATSVYNRLTEFTNLKVKAADFNQTIFERYVDSLRNDGRQDSTIRSYLLVISGAWNSANKKLYEIPALTLPKVKRSKKRTKWVTPDEENQLLDFVKNRPFRARKGADVRHNELHDVLVLLMDTGARSNEIVQLQWSQIDLKNRRLDIWRSKTESATYLAMSNRVHEVLQRRAESKLNDLWVFPNQLNTNHRTLSTCYLNDIIKEAGIDKTCHHIRHGFATKLLKNGFTIADVQKTLGHANISTTADIYGHLEPTEVSGRVADFLNKKSVEDRRSTMKVV